VTASSDVVTVVKQVFDSVERRDNALFEAAVDKDLELHWPPELPYGGVFWGLYPDRPGWGTTWNPLQPTEAERRLDPRIIASSSEEAVVLWHQRGLAPSGERIDTPVLGLYRVIGGRLLRGQMFYFDPRAAARFIADANSKPTER
jgi:ketosteroid isomerase-like protein